MSSQILQISCTSCTFSTSLFHDTFFYYESGDKKIAAPVMPGWCMDCKSIEVIHTGLSPVGLGNEIKHMNQEYKELITLDTENSYVKTKISELEHNKFLKEKYLEIIENQSSISHCTTCGSVKVFPMPIYYSHEPRIPTEAFIHPGCRGQLRAELSGARFSFSGSSKKLEPKLGWPWYSDVL